MHKSIPLIALLITSSAIAQPKLIPSPHSYSEGYGNTLITPATIIVYDALLKSEARLLSEQLRAITGSVHPLIEESDASPKSAIVLDLNKGAKSSYSLSSAAQKVVIKGGDPAGVFYGIQTLLQLLPEKNSEQSTFSFKDCSILDQPNNPQRSIHLNESPHFYGKEWVKRYIDLISAHKLNTLHWHLAGDQGWRIEIKQYPKLTQFGAYRKDSPAESNKPTIAKSAEDFKTGKWIGGFHTQDDIKEVISYAAARHIRVFPTIKTPANALPATTNYPELLSSDQEKVFLENVLTELQSLISDKQLNNAQHQLSPQNSIWNTRLENQQHLERVIQPTIQTRAESLWKNAAQKNKSPNTSQATPSKRLRLPQLPPKAPSSTLG